MSDERLVAVGRVGRPHGVDGSFHVEGPSHPLALGTEVTVAGSHRTVERRAGTAERPLVRVAGVADRDAAGGLRGQPLLVRERDAPLAEEEWLVDDLVGCRVLSAEEGRDLGEVRSILHGPSCDVLEVGSDGLLVPLIRDAVGRVDPALGVIEVDLRFLGLDPEGTAGGG